MKQLPTDYYETMAKSHVLGATLELMMKQDDDGVINVRVCRTAPDGHIEDTLIKTEVQL